MTNYLAFSYLWEKMYFATKTHEMNLFLKFNFLPLTGSWYFRQRARPWSKCESVFNVCVTLFHHH